MQRLCSSAFNSLCTPLPGLLLDMTINHQVKIYAAAASLHALGMVSSWAEIEVFAELCMFNDFIPFLCLFEHKSSMYA